MTATQTHTDADEFWALADQHLAEANDPTATPEQTAYARNLYTRAMHDAEQAEQEAADAKRRVVTKRAERIRILRDMVSRKSTVEGERAAAQHLLDKLEEAADRASRNYGSKYDHADTLAAKDIAAIVRAEIKVARQVAAQTADLPTGPGEVAVFDPIGTMPTSVKVSVKSQRYQGGQAIRVRLDDIPQAWGFVPAAEPTKYRIHDSSPALKALYAALMGVLESYNHDGSDLVSGYSDVRFYGSVDYYLPEDLAQIQKGA
jgi:hypothetical protein